ncbi:MAG: nucleotidyltransferase family protein [Candidatus Liptonbacteria bacterium]|nr:nucleotidyltransferase family protein [Candidatus Liptonbacteria bacterium]
MKRGVEQIKQILRDNMEVLTKNHRVKKLGVFGSVARGDETDMSDLDVLVEFSEPTSLFRFLDLESYLKSILGREIDLVTAGGIKPAIKEDILREVIYV